MIQLAMTPEEFTAKAAQLKAQEGVELTGTEGTIAKNGVAAAWMYHDGELSVTITHKPFFVPLEICESKLHEWLTAPAKT